MPSTIVYTLENCPNCEKAKSLLKSKNISFQIRDLNDPDSLSELNLKKIFPMSAPVIFHKSQFFTNFDSFVGDI